MSGLVTALLLTVTLCHAFVEFLPAGTPPLPILEELSKTYEAVPFPILVCPSVEMLARTASNIKNVENMWNSPVYDPS
jgi:hypothetical protein